MQAIGLCYSLEPKSRIRPPISDREDSVRLAPGRCAEGDARCIQPCRPERALEKALRAGFRLAWHRRAPGQVLEAVYRARIGIANDESAPPDDPCDEGNVFAGEFGFDGRDVPFAACGVVDVEPRSHPFTGAKPGEAVEAAVEKSGETRARLADSPVEKRIMAAEKDCRPPATRCRAG